MGFTNAIGNAAAKASSKLPVQSAVDTSKKGKGWQVIPDATREAVLHIPSPSSPASEWIEWHKTIKDLMGKKKANDEWLYAWNNRKGSSGWGLNGTDANTVELRKYIESQGMTIEKDGLLEYGADAADSVEGTFKKFVGIGSTITIICIVVALSLVFYALYNIAKNPGAAVGTAAKYAV